MSSKIEDLKFSLRKSRAPKGNWANYEKKKVDNPYAGFNLVNDTSNAQLQIPNEQQKKANKKVSRRFSVHQAQAPKIGNFDISDMPPLPVMGDYNIEPSPNSAPVKMEKRHDTSKPVKSQEEESLNMGASGFNVKQFIMKELGTASSSKIDDFNKSLIQMDKKVTKDIKQTFNENHKQILSLNEDILVTEQELKILRNSTIEIFDIIQQMKDGAERRLAIENESKEPTAKAQRDRSSIIVLEKMWANELNSLFKHVEGAQKFLTPVPGRHVVAESGRWYELNVATWKPIKPAHLFLLNDRLLIANKKKKSKDNEDYKSQKLTATQCWPLRDVTITDISKNKTNASESSSYTINIKFNSLSYIYQTDRYDHYTKVMKTFKKAKEDILKQAAPGSEDSSDLKRLKSTKSLKNSAVLDKKNHRNSGVLLQGISARMHSRNRSVDLDKNHFLDLKLIDDKIDELDTDIAHHRYQNSVDLIQFCDDKLSIVSLETSQKQEENQINEEAKLLSEVIKLKLDQRKEQLNKLLIFELNNQRFLHSGVNEIMRWFKELKLEKLGRDSFLDSESNLISKFVRQVVFEGDIPNYITQICVITFQCIKKTMRIYQQCFPEKELSSYITTWAIQEVENFVFLMKKQLYGVHIESTAYTDCVSTIKEQVSQLQKSGMNVDFLLESFYTAVE